MYRNLSFALLTKIRIMRMVTMRLHKRIFVEKTRKHGTNENIDIF